MNAGFMLIDASNWGFAASSMKRLSVGDQDTQGAFGFIRRLRESVAQYPMLTPIILNDGISWRYDAYADYKGDRNKPAVTKNEIAQAEIRKSYKSQKKMINDAVDLLGVRRMFALNMEADDLAAITVRRYADKKRIVLMSGDKDWIQLVGKNVVWVDLINNRRIGFNTFGTKTPSTESVGIGFERKSGEWVGLTRPDQWAEVKSLQGDKSDSVTGVGGIGEKGAVEFIVKYGSVNNFFNGFLDKSIDPEKLPAKFREFAISEQKHDIYRRNMQLMDLNSSAIPVPNGLTLTKPSLDEAGFEAFCRKWMFQSILTGGSEWLAPFRGVTA